VCVTADDQFGHQRGVGQGKGQQQVDQQEGGTAVAGGLGGETPDIAQAHRAAGGCHYKAKTRAEFTSSGCHRDPWVISLLLVGSLA